MGAGARGSDLLNITQLVAVKLIRIFLFTMVPCSIAREIGLTTGHMV